MGKGSCSTLMGQLATRGISKMDCLMGMGQLIGAIIRFRGPFNVESQRRI
jgi:hypothetical protein